MKHPTSHLHVVLPIAGTTYWSPTGKALGVWGKDLEIKPKVLLANGSIRDLTKAEARFYRHCEGASYGGT